MKICGGGGGIRTPGTLSRSTVFKTAAIDHSATPPATDSLKHVFAILKDPKSAKWSWISA